MDSLRDRDQATRRLADLINRRPRKRDVIEFHTRHKMLLLAHSPQRYASLGKVVADGEPTPEWLAEYARAFRATLDQTPTVGSDVNALQHLAGHLRGLVTDAERDELALAILEYQQGKVPRTTPIDLLRHHAVAHHVKYLSEQFYLFP